MNIPGKKWGFLVKYFLILFIIILRVSTSRDYTNDFFASFMLNIAIYLKLKINTKKGLIKIKINTINLIFFENWTTMIIDIEIRKFK